MKNSADTPSLAAEAYMHVRTRLMRGELVLGQVISRRKLAAELGMSFLPVSEALQRLEVEGLLESRPRAGTRVRIPSREDVLGHYIVREALEVQAAMLFAQVATPGERTELRKLAARVDALSARPDRTLFTILHHKLHRRIAECTRCAMLTDVIERTQVLSTIWFCALRQPAPTDPPHRHGELLERLTLGTPAEAGEAMRGHVAVGLKHSLGTLEPYFKLRKSSRKTFFRSERKQSLHVVARRAANVRYLNDRSSSE